MGATSRSGPTGRVLFLEPTKETGGGAFMGPPLNRPPQGTLRGARARSARKTPQRLGQREAPRRPALGGTLGDEARRPAHLPRTWGGRRKEARGGRQGEAEGDKAAGVGSAVFSPVKRGKGPLPGRGARQDEAEGGQSRRPFQLLHRAGGVRPSPGRRGRAARRPIPPAPTQSWCVPERPREPQEALTSAASASLSGLPRPEPRGRRGDAAGPLKAGPRPPPPPSLRRRRRSSPAKGTPRRRRGSPRPGPAACARCLFGAPRPPQPHRPGRDRPLVLPRCWCCCCCCCPLRGAQRPSAGPALAGAFQSLAGPAHRPPLSLSLFGAGGGGGRVWPPGQLSSCGSSRKAGISREKKGKAGLLAGPPPPPSFAAQPPLKKRPPLPLRRNRDPRHPVPQPPVFAPGGGCGRAGRTLDLFADGPEQRPPPPTPGAPPALGTGHRCQPGRTGATCSSWSSSRPPPSRSRRGRGGRWARSGPKRPPPPPPSWRRRRPFQISALLILSKARFSSPGPLLRKHVAGHQLPLWVTFPFLFSPPPPGTRQESPLTWQPERDKMSWGRRSGGEGRQFRAALAAAGPGEGAAVPKNPGGSWPEVRVFHGNPKVRHCIRDSSLEKPLPVNTEFFTESRAVPVLLQTTHSRFWGITNLINKSIQISWRRRPPNARRLMAVLQRACSEGQQLMGAPFPPSISQGSGAGGFLAALQFPAEGGFCSS